MLNCTQAEKMILAGEKSEELSLHLQSCSSCAALQQDTAWIMEQTNVRQKEKQNLQIPEQLDLSIKAAAASAVSCRKQARNSSRKFAFWILSAAASFAVCLGLLISFQGPSLTVRAKPLAAESVLKEEVPAGNTDAVQFILEEEEFYDQVTALSLELEYATSGDGLAYNDMILSQLSSDGTIFFQY